MKSMKKIMLTVLTMSCLSAFSLGVMIHASAADTEPTKFKSLDGAAVKVMQTEKDSGIRFTYLIEKDYFDTLLDGNSFKAGVSVTSYIAPTDILDATRETVTAEDFLEEGSGAIYKEIPAEKWTVYQVWDAEEEKYVDYVDENEDTWMASYAWLSEIAPKSYTRDISSMAQLIDGENTYNTDVETRSIVEVANGLLYVKNDQEHKEILEKYLEGYSYELSLDKETVDLAYEGSEVTTTLTASTNLGTKLIWESSNENVATVENGVVTAKAEGQATITVTAVGSGETDTCVINIDNPMTLSFEDGEETPGFKNGANLTKIEVYETGTVSTVCTGATGYKDPSLYTAHTGTKMLRMETGKADTSWAFRIKLTAEMAKGIKEGGDLSFWARVHFAAYSSKEQYIDIGVYNVTSKTTVVGATISGTNKTGNAGAGTLTEWQQFTFSDVEIDTSTNEFVLKPDTSAYADPGQKKIINIFIDDITVTEKVVVDDPLTLGFEDNEYTPGITPGTYGYKVEVYEVGTVSTVCCDANNYMDPDSYTAHTGTKMLRFESKNWAGSHTFRVKLTQEMVEAIQAGGTLSFWVRAHFPQYNSKEQSINIGVYNVTSKTTMVGATISGTNKSGNANSGTLTEWQKLEFTGVEIDTKTNEVVIKPDTTGCVGAYINLFIDDITVTPKA